MNSFPSSAGLQLRLGDILTPACVPLQTLPDVFGELNLAANCRARRRPALLLYACWHSDFPQFVIFPATVTLTPFQPHTGTAARHTQKHAAFVGENIHIH